MKKISLFLFALLVAMFCALPSMAQTIYSENGSIIIEGVGIYPVGTIIIKEDSGNFIFTSVTGNDTRYQEYGVRYSNVRDINGDLVGSLSAVRDYLKEIVNKSYDAGSTKISTLNSSTSALTAGSTFTGWWEDVTAYECIVVSAKTDQNGTYSLQLSSDTAAVESTLTRYYRTNQIEPPHRFSKTRKFARVVFANTSASNQTSLKLQVILGSVVALNIPLDANVSQDYDATVVRPTNYNYEVALNRRQGATTWNKFGYNSDIDVGTEVIGAYGGTFTRLTTASTFSVVSSSAQDILTSGTGAWNIIVHYVDSSWRAQTAVVPLNGTTNVVTTWKAMGINRVALYNTGSGDVNAGNITITATAGGSVQAYIPSGEGTTQQMVFFTQDSHQDLVDYLYLNACKVSGGGGSPRVIIKGWVYSNVSTAKYLVFSTTIDTSIENTIELTPVQPFVIGEKSVLWFEATTDINNTGVSGRFSHIEVRDVDSE
jgi:hypothetical protein